MNVYNQEQIYQHYFGRPGISELINFIHSLRLTLPSLTLLFTSITIQQEGCIQRNIS